MTHWQHPSFFAYFPANASPPSVLAEMLTSTLGAQCMSWVTSPAATELEERVMEWLGEMLGLPACVARRHPGHRIDRHALLHPDALEKRGRTFRSTSGGSRARRDSPCTAPAETHSSIEKAVKIAGIGRENLRKIPVDEAFALRPDALEAAITADLARGTHASLRGRHARDDGLRRRSIRSGRSARSASATKPGSMSTRHSPVRRLVLPELRWMIDGHRIRRYVRRSILISGC